MDKRLVRVFAVCTGLVVANNYYAQPLLAAIARSFDASTTSVGLIVTATQVGYALGLAFVVPLGDRVDRRRLLSVLIGVSIVALGAMGAAPGWEVLGAASLVVGVSTVVGQILVPLAATLAADDERGRVIGNVMTGLLLGILGSRVVAGLVGQIAGWRTMFFVASGAMVVTLVWLRRRLPDVAPSSPLPYRRLLGSVVDLVRDEPILRERMLYGAATFASFGVFWTSVAFLLAGPPFDWSDAVIGAFTLFGVAGAVAAQFAGRLADRGHARVQTGVFIAATVASFVLVYVGAHNVVLLAAGVAMMELGIQGTHITNQHEFYALRPDARSRLNTAYMTAYFAAGSAGSGLSAWLYGAHGWGAVCVAGAVFPVIGLVVWVAHRRPRRIDDPSVA
ncbi:MAG: MFS transporter [Actinobacteria bacterium]|nr:MFS transporter [Actinomycetota bacterium]